MNKGRLFVLNIQKSKTIDDEKALKIFGVRIAKFLPQGWVYRDNLAPSKKLLFASKDMEKKGTWNELSFQNFYKPNFLKEVSANPKAKDEILEIATQLNNGIDVYYACYCKHHHLCHRSIVAEIFERNGYEVNKQ